MSTSLAFGRKLALSVSEQAVDALRTLILQRDAIFARLEVLRNRAVPSETESEDGGEEHGPSCLDPQCAQTDAAHNAGSLILDGVAADADADDKPLSLEEQVCLSMGQTLQVFAGTHIDAALSCLAHNPRAFEAIKAEIEPDMVQHWLDSAADDVAYGPLMGFSPEAVTTGDMLMVGEHVRAAQALHERILQLLKEAGA
ncbi:MAG TPA: hypothetical protein PLC15_02320 [Candidatus Obscuribacter sp.]|nr:hypothetical protein [Candidatus Obscuribacter sp.]HNB14183.1 hypothetical protein [Candidatus Obscuribacter sp.]HNG77110.1 hypothetical protein [Candidatus Obscuribacter sp.]